MKYKKETVKKYISMFDDYKMDELILSTIKKYLKEGDTILELGSGGGFDYEELSKTFNVTGSDYSEEFTKVLKEKFNKDFQEIDARNISVSKQYDLIYSNKVLHHLNKKELKASIKSQYENIKEGGYLIATLWYGDFIEEMQSMVFHYYTEKDVKDVLDNFNLEEIIKYEEFEKDDSLLIVLRR